MFRKTNSLALPIVFILLFSVLALPIQEVKATNYNVKDKATCQKMNGSWNPLFTTCAINGLQLYNTDKLVVGPNMHLENIGIITNDGGAIYNYGIIMTDEFSVIYNNNDGNIYNYGTITNSAGTINNYASIHNLDGIINNYGSAYNYGTIYNYNDSIIDDRHGVIYNNNGTINNDCSSVFNGFAPYGNQVRNICLPVNPSSLLPLQQVKDGTPVQKVKCNASLVLIIKSDSGMPACVMPGTAKMLEERGWAK
ncbi:MAG: hypothetical protein ACREA7_03620 [Nitrosotalea sp.]